MAEDRIDEIYSILIRRYGWGMWGDDSALRNNPPDSIEEFVDELRRIDGRVPDLADAADRKVLVSLVEDWIFADDGVGTRSGLPISLPRRIRDPRTAYWQSIALRGGLVSEPSAAPMDDVRRHFSYLATHLGRAFGTDVTYREVVRYVEGFGDASDSLDGFHGWLVERLGGGRSIHWSGLIGFDLFGVEPVQYVFDLPQDYAERVRVADRELVHHLFGLLETFFALEEHSRQL